MLASGREKREKKKGGELDTPGAILFFYHPQYPGIKTRLGKRKGEIKELW